MPVRQSHGEVLRLILYHLLSDSAARLTASLAQTALASFSRPILVGRHYRDGCRTERLPSQSHLVGVQDGGTGNEQIALLSWHCLGSLPHQYCIQYNAVTYLQGQDARDYKSAVQNNHPRSLCLVFIGSVLLVSMYHRRANRHVTCEVEEQHGMLFSVQTKAIVFLCKKKSTKKKETKKKKR